MISVAKCSAPGCGAPVNSETTRGSRGFCNPHYRRWLAHGDPLGGKIARGTLTRFLHEVVLEYDGDECLFWPYSKTVFGYGQIKLEGRNQSVHRIVCESTHGTPPSHRHQAAHACGKGHLGCVAKRHLSWKTETENALDKFEHGTVLRGEDNPSCKLSAEAVLKIRSLIGRVQQKEIAKEFGISPASIRKIAAGKTWSWLHEGRVL